MNELDLKEIIWIFHERLKQLEIHTEYGAPDFIKRSDEYIEKVLDSIKEGE